MTDFHKSLDAALTRGAANPLYLIAPEDCCEVCGCLLRDNRATALAICPFAPHDEPKDAA